MDDMHGMLYAWIRSMKGWKDGKDQILQEILHMRRKSLAVTVDGQSLNVTNIEPVQELQ